MRLLLLLIAGTLVASQVDAQERWRQLPGVAGAYAVDLQSLGVAEGVLRARVRTRDYGTVVLVEELEVQCSAEQLRTITAALVRLPQHGMKLPFNLSGAHDPTGPVNASSPARAQIIHDSILPEEGMIG